MKERIIKPLRTNPMDIGVVGPKVTPMYPKITLSHKDLPEAKDWKMGETYHIEMDIKMVRSAQTNNKDEIYSNESTFEIKKIAVDDDSDEAEE